MLVIVAGGLAGCVERTARIETDPPGALVTVNDEEVGVSPVRFSFQWYGDYDIIIRKQGYETLKTSYRIDAPWYQWPPFDIVAEAMVPAKIHDAHQLPTFVLKPAEPRLAAEVVEEAEGLRQRALFQGN
jgi:hypothetical protein